MRGDQYCSRYMVGTRGKGEITTGTNHLGFRCVSDLEKWDQAHDKVQFSTRRQTMRQEIRSTVTKLGMALILLLAACALTPAQEVSTNAMPGVDFSKYHTYKWVTIEGATYPNQIVDAQIKQAVDRQLAAKGLTKTDGEKADLLIGYQASVSTDKQWNAYGTG